MSRGLKTRSKKQISWWLEVQVFVVGAERLVDEDRVEALYQNRLMLEQKKRSHEDHWKQHLTIGRPRTKNLIQKNSVSRASRMRLVGRCSLEEGGNISILS